MTSTDTSTVPFEQPDLLSVLNNATAAGLDALSIGVIHFDGNYIVQRYNRFEQLQTGLSADSVIGMHVFTELAQCMNNFMVAEKFADAQASGEPLDLTIDYVLTWKMKPTPVLLRMLSSPAQAGGYIVLKRLR